MRYWAARTLVSSRQAVAAVLVLGTMFFIIRQGRLASYDTHLAAWTTLAVAAGLNAILRPPSRKTSRVLLWVLGGLALAAAVLTKGPLALVLTLPPVIGIALVKGACKPKEGPPLFLSMAGLAGMLAVCAACALPWYQYLTQSFGEALPGLMKEYKAQRQDIQPPWYYIGILGLIFPWSLWLMDGLSIPFRRKWSRTDISVLAPWLWFVLLFLLLSIPGAKQQRYIVPAAPAAAWLCAIAWMQKETGRWRLCLMRIHWSMLAGLSILVPLFVMLQPTLVQSGVLESPELEGARWWHALILLPLMLWAVKSGYHAHRQSMHNTALYFSTGWMILTAVYGFTFYPLSHHGRYEWKADCLQVREMTKQAPLYYLEVAGQKKLMPDEKFLFYVGRVIPGRTESALESLDTRATSYTITDARPDHAYRMEALGWENILEFEDGRRTRHLYRKDP